MRRTNLLTGCLALAVAAAGTGSPAGAQPRTASLPAPVPAALAAASADRLVAADTPSLHLAAGDTLKRTGVLAGTRGLQYVSYARTHRGLPVVGGDVVVTTDAAGAVRGTAVAQRTTIGVGTTAAVSAQDAAATARARLSTVDDARPARLAVLAWGARPRLVWEAVVAGRAKDGHPSVQHVYVDAASGAVVDHVELVREGSGSGFYYGPVTIGASGAGTSFSLTDPARRGLQCGGQNGAAFTGADDVWGNGSGTNLETACVDALYAAGQESDMLREWFNRNGMRGDGSTPPIRVGLSAVNAFWNGSYTNFGRNQANDRQLTPIDVVAHEMGHAIFQFTPGGVGSSGDSENGGINEATGDIFGALTEAYANNPQDAPDYTVGEEADLVGQGPIRYMYDPSRVGDPNCFSPAIPSTEVHAAAGPLNHWFYLAAEGSAPTGRPASPTCDNSTVTGLGIRAVGEIFYNALLAKTSSWRHVDVRTATLNAAKNLHPATCAPFHAVRAAWNAVNVPARSSEPTCNLTGNDFSVAVQPSAVQVTAGSSVSVAVSTTVTAGTAHAVTLTAGGLPAGTTATFSPASVLSGSAATLTIEASLSAPGGSYPVTVTGTGDDTRTASLSLVVVGAPGCSGANARSVAIPDLSTVTSTVPIGGCGRNASAATTVAVAIAHTYRGDLVIDLVSPDGSVYRLKPSSSSDGADNVAATYRVDASDEPADGTWTLRVQDVARADTGTLTSWSLTL